MCRVIEVGFSDAYLWRAPPPAPEFLCDGFILRRLKVGIGFSPLVMFYRSGVDAVKVPRSTAPGARVVVFGVHQRGC